MNKTKIEWTASTQPDGTITTGYTANPIRYRDAGGAASWGCIKASEGCQQWYAESISKRFHGRGAVFTAKRMESLTPFVDGHHHCRRDELALAAQALYDQHTELLEKRPWVETAIAREAAPKRVVVPQEGTE